ncbi:predicted protein [Nematostella vectensis]|uniref:Uncharacterized protein n=1 Tax=Nematostella vectensis TaxID=45351 RepID=A7T1B3_NEMVE|nr:predicted protein [Nematostella vectensis]|eukprot:XP_001622350.1 predicted protein [Nematostella vectensis]
MGFSPVPLQQRHLLLYAAFLARSLKPTSIRSYLNIIGILHKEFGLPNPLLNNWSLQALLTGIKRAKGSPPNQKQPITTALLHRIFATLNHRSSLDASFWAICLVAFYGMFRKSHLLPTSATRFDADKQLTKADITIQPWGALVTIHWSKTIQFRERVVEIPLPRIPGSEICPTSAIEHAVHFNSSSGARSQAFDWMEDRAPRIFTYKKFVTKLRHHLALCNVT